MKKLVFSALILLMAVGSFFLVRDYNNGRIKFEPQVTYINDVMNDIDSLKVDSLSVDSLTTDSLRINL